MPRRPTLLRTRWTRIRSTRRFWTARTLWLRWQRRSSSRTRCRAVEGGEEAAAGRQHEARTRGAAGGRIGVPKRIRTYVAAGNRRSPGPLDDRDAGIGRGGSRLEEMPFRPDSNQFYMRETE